MSRKKWTPQTEITTALLKFREKRKWQLALRRYIFEKNASLAYAPYFGLTITKMREWIQIQLSSDLSWDNFGSKWQIDHIVPLTYFDFSVNDDLILCWNFTNLRVVEKTDWDSGTGNKVNILAAKAFFKSLYNETNYHVCHKMVEKIEEIEQSAPRFDPIITGFIKDNKGYIESLSSLGSEDFARLNTGMDLKDILLEKAILQKFG